MLASACADRRRCGADCVLGASGDRVEFDEGDAIHRLDQSAVWDLPRLQELAVRP